MGKSAQNSDWDRILSERLDRKLRAEGPMADSAREEAPGATGWHVREKSAGPTEQPERSRTAVPRPGGTTRAPGPRGLSASLSARQAGAQAGVSSAELVVEELKRALSPREEKRALRVLRGKRRPGAGGLVLVIGALAAVLSAGGAFVLGQRARVGGELRLSTGFVPPAERALSAAPRLPAVPRAAPRGAAGDGRDGVPVFRVGVAPPRTEWIDLGGPLVDLDLRPPRTTTGP